MNLDAEPGVEALADAWHVIAWDLPLMLMPCSHATMFAYGHLVGALAKAMDIYRPGFPLARRYSDKVMSGTPEQAYTWLGELKDNLGRLAPRPRDRARAFDAGYALGVVLTQMESLRSQVGRDIADQRRAGESAADGGVTTVSG